MKSHGSHWARLRPNTCTPASRSQHSLRFKLICSYLLLILLPITLLGGFSYATVRDILVKQSSDAYFQSVRQAGASIGYAMDGYQASADIVRNNYKLASALRALRLRSLSPGEEYDVFNELNSILETLRAQPGVLAVRMAVDGDATFVSDIFDIFNIRLLKQDAVYESIRSLYTYLWLPSAEFTRVRCTSDASYTLCIPITDYAANGQKLGYIFIEVDDEVLFAAPLNFELPDGSYLLLLGADGVYDTGADKYSNLTEESMSELANGLNPAQLRHTPPGIGSCELGGQRHITLSADISAQQFRVLALVPETALAHVGASLTSAIIAVAMLLSAIAIYFAVLLTRSINRRLQRLVESMQRLQGGEWGMTAPVSGNDEYAYLQLTCNEMSLKIKQLVDELLESQQKQRAAELRILYEQINPHFVYNTLDIIRWEALRAHANETASLVSALAAYMRLTLNHGDEFTTVARELDEVSQYMQIMNHRYNGRIEFAVNADKSVRQRPIIKQILQPLVENAVIHGIMCKPEKRGNISIGCHSQLINGDDCIVFTVSDDGAGMENEVAQMLTARSEDHYGVWNVHKRIQASYGQKSGLSYKSSPGKGCMITVTLDISATMAPP